MTNVDLALLVEAERIRAIVLNHIGASAVVRKLFGVLVVTDANPLVTVKSAVSIEGASQRNLGLRVVIGEVGQTGFHDGSHILRNTGLITLTDDVLDDGVGVAIVIFGNDKGSTTVVGSGVLSGWSSPRSTPGVRGARRLRSPGIIVRSGRVDGEGQRGSGEGEVHGRERSLAPKVGFLGGSRGCEGRASKLWREAHYCERVRVRDKACHTNAS